MVTTQSFLIATAIWLIVLAITYSFIGWTNIVNCYRLYFNRSYWDSINTVEFVSWITRCTIVLPGMIWEAHFWQMFLFTLATSCALVWVSYKKELPTLVLFNSIWAWISLIGIFKHVIE